MAKTVTRFRRQGDAILERARALPAALLAPVQAHYAAFAAVHGEYVAACDAADLDRESRDAGLVKLAKTDEALDASLLSLADWLVGAGLGARKNPFAAYSPYSPGAMTDLGYDKTVKATRDLVQKLVALAPNADVHEATHACLQAATAVEHALAGLQAPQAKFEMAMAERDGLLPGWAKARDRFKKHAAAHWLDQPEVFKAVFKSVK
jgi:hypothetical protein